MERFAQISFVLAVLVVFVSHGFAQERVFSEYEYDEVGNIISRTQDVSGAAPSISQVNPSTVRQNQELRISLLGEGLRGAQLGDQVPFFSFTDIESSNEELSFTLSVDKDADEGPAQISLSTGLGTVFFSLNVLTELPDLRVSPTPLTLTPGAISNLRISLSTPDVLDHFVAVSIADTSIATISVPQISFIQGSLFPDQAIILTALSNGSTSLTFESETLGTYTFNLRVTNDEFILTPGSTVSFSSRTVGLNKLFTPPPPDLIAQGPFIGELRVNKLFTTQDTAGQRNTLTRPLGLLKGIYHIAPEPNAIGANVDLQRVIVQGRGLSGVTAVSIFPDENVRVSDLEVDSTGQSISFDIGVDANTPFAIRRLVLRDSNGTIEPVSASANRIYIGGATPIIESVSPIFFNRGDSRVVTVRGSNLSTVRGVRFDNQDNLAISNLNSAPDGRSLTFSLEVQGFATIGSRLLTLESLLGDSLPSHSAANQINIEDSPPITRSPVVSAALGVNRLTAPVVSENRQTVRSNSIGVVKGLALSRITPNSRSQGSSVTLSLLGNGLNDVVSSEFEPSEGITVNDYIPDPDGQSATLSIDIAEDALPSIRRLKLITASNVLAVAPGADRFTVTLPRPQITSVSPILIDRSQGVVPLTLRGELLDNASLLTVIPSDGVTVSVPVASLDGRAVEASLTLASDAPLIPRTLQLTTPGGVTEAQAMLTNTVQVVSSLSSVVTPIVAPQVGVVRESTVTSPPDEIRSVSSNLVGIVRNFTSPPQTQTNLAYALPVGLTKGPSVFSFSPNTLPIGTSNQTIEVIGSNLDNVTIVQTVPADGVLLSGPALISADGTRVTFSASVDTSAPQTARRLELLTANGSVPYILPVNSQLRVAGLQPELESIDPIQEVRGANFTMTIRGINLGDIQSIQATPSNGIQFGTPVVSPDGRVLTVPVIISITAAAEQKVITVTTIDGTSTSAAMPENTFTVISE